MPENETHGYCDYAGSDYRTAFWGDSKRAYEDAAERIALRRLLPPVGGRLIEIGAGFGRLADLYAGYREVILLDPAESMLRQAQERLGNEGFTYVCGSVYNLPLNDASMDTVLTIRVLHHLKDVPLALREIRRTARANGRYILEYANKRNLKAMTRYLLGRGATPFSQEPYEFVPLNFDFHPIYMKRQLQQAGFALGKELSVSNLRLSVLKRAFSPQALAAVDGWLQVPLAPLKLGPSIFVEAVPQGKDPIVDSQALFRCPRCHSTDLEEERTALVCQECGCAWAINDGIYDFMGPITRP